MLTISFFLLLSFPSTELIFLQHSPPLDVEVRDPGRPPMLEEDRTSLLPFYLHMRVSIFFSGQFCSQRSASQYNTSICDDKSHNSLTQPPQDTSHVLLANNLQTIIDVVAFLGNVIFPPAFLSK